MGYWPPERSTFVRALWEYHAKHICREDKGDGTPPAYLWGKNPDGSPFNEDNFVPKPEWPRELATVINLSSWIDRASAKGVLGPLTNPLPRPGSAETSESTDHLAIARQLLPKIWPIRDRRPTWVTDWDKFKHAVDPACPSTWVSDVGVWALKDSWLVVLRYPSPEWLS